MRIFGFFVLALPLIFGLALIFSPIYTLYVLYRLIEFIGKLFGDECQENLRSKYENLGENPKAYEQAHPLYSIYGRVIGILIPITFAWLLTLM
jgi:hypothetical protein